MEATMEVTMEVTMVITSATTITIVTIIMGTMAIIAMETITVIGITMGGIMVIIMDGGGDITTLPIFGELRALRLATEPPIFGLQVNPIIRMCKGSFLHLC